MLANSRWDLIQGLKGKRDRAWSIRKINISCFLFCSDFADRRPVGRPPVSLELFVLFSPSPRGKYLPAV
jgi:hypothetical protein